jgi:cytochrome b pre-mRNA-processing protein 3
MILPFFRRPQQTDTISALYGTIVAQARLPSFYRDYGVPDTVDSRFDLIVLHLAVLLRRLNGENEAGRGLGQRVFDRFCQDMDQNLREMGIGDLNIPDEMRRVGAAFYGRARAYSAALDQQNDEVLIEAAARNLYGSAPGAVSGAARAAAYVRRAVACLAAQETAAIARGELSFPQP